MRRPLSYFAKFEFENIIFNFSRQKNDIVEFKIIIQLTTSVTSDVLSKKCKNLKLKLPIKIIERLTLMKKKHISVLIYSRSIFLLLGLFCKVMTIKVTVAYLHLICLITLLSFLVSFKIRKKKKITGITIFNYFPLIFIFAYVNDVTYLDIFDLISKISSQLLEKKF